MTTEKKHFLDHVQLDNPSIHENYNVIQKRLKTLKTISGFYTIAEVSLMINETEAHTKYLLCNEESTELSLLGRTILISELSAQKFVSEYTKQKASAEQQKIKDIALKEKARIEKEKERAEKIAEREKNRVEKEKARIENTIKSQKEQIKRLSEIVKSQPENVEYRKMLDDLKKIVLPQALQ